MLKSLFGELTTTPLTGSGVLPEFAATAVLESTETHVSQSGRMVERHQHELFVTGSPAQAMRQHLAATRQTPDVHTITLLDPGRLWAPGVVKALSDATGQPVDRLHLRQQATLRILATLERTIVPRRGDPTLKIYHADVPVDDGDSLEIPFALMESSQMSAVIVGAMQPPAVDAMLLALRHATRSPSWRCGSLLFLLPPQAVWVAARIAGIDWPPALQVEVVDEPLTGTSSVWNALLSTWDRLQAAPALPPGANPGIDDDRRIARELRQLMQTDGVLGCGLVDATDGDLIAGESRHAAVDLPRAAAALAPVVRAHREAHAAMGLPGVLEEVTVAAGTAHHLVRPFVRHPGRFLFARIERAHANLALLRFKLAEAERNLG